MNLTYFDTTGVEHLVEEYYELSFSKDIVPFHSTLLPIALTNITYIFSGDQKAIVKGQEMPLKGLIVSGQIFRSYKFFVNKEGESFGMSLHPTALYKLLNINVSKLTNKHVPLEEVHEDLFKKLNPIFLEHKDANDTISKINDLILGTELTVTKNTELIDTAIEIIKKKDGMLSIEDILKETECSQKTLETQFKKIVGQTPGRYIRLFRFLKLMRKYESQQIELKDLIYMYNYYDQSHFAKDFKLFMLESPRSYFKTEYPLLKKYLGK